MQRFSIRLCRSQTKYLDYLRQEIRSKIFCLQDGVNLYNTQVGRRVNVLVYELKNQKVDPGEGGPPPPMRQKGRWQFTLRVRKLSHHSEKFWTTKGIFGCTSEKPHQFHKLKESLPPRKCCSGSATEQHQLHNYDLKDWMNELTLNYTIEKVKYVSRKSKKLILMKQILISVRPSHLQWRTSLKIFIR